MAHSGRDRSHGSFSKHITWTMITILNGWGRGRVGRWKYKYQVMSEIEISCQASSPNGWGKNCGVVDFK